MSVFETQYEEEYATQGESVLGGELEEELANQLPRGPERGGARAVPRRPREERCQGRRRLHQVAGRQGAGRRAQERRQGGAAQRPAARSARSSRRASAPRSAARLGSAASNLFELELEGMDREQAEFEAARSSTCASPRPRRATSRSADQDRPAMDAGERRGRRRGPRAPRPGLLACAVTAVPVAGRPRRPLGAARPSNRGPRGLRHGRRAAECAAGPASRTVARAGRGRRHAWLLEQEARALLTRLGRVRPFALQETMLPAAALIAGARRSRSSAS